MDVSRERGKRVACLGRASAVAHGHVAVAVAVKVKVNDHVNVGTHESRDDVNDVNVNVDARAPRLMRDRSIRP